MSPWNGVEVKILCRAARGCPEGDPHLNPAQPVVNAPLAKDWPPVVEKVFQRSPQRDPTDDEQAQCPLQAPRLPGEVIADGVPEGILLFGKAGRLVEMNHERACRSRGQLPEAVDDVLLGLEVQVFFGERRRVERVEQLAQLPKADLDDAGRMRARSAES
jgi:hypothetical protein